MPKFPSPNGAEMVRFLKSHRFEVVRIRGSHHVMQCGSLKTTVPVHGNQALRIGTLRAILRDVEISPKEFTELWDAQ